MDNPVSLKRGSNWINKNLRILSDILSEELSLYELSLRVLNFFSELNPVCRPVMYYHLREGTLHRIETPHGDPGPELPPENIHQLMCGQLQIQVPHQQQKVHGQHCFVLPVQLQEGRQLLLLIFNLTPFSEKQLDFMVAAGERIAVTLRRVFVGELQLSALEIARLQANALVDANLNLKIQSGKLCIEREKIQFINNSLQDAKLALERKNIENELLLKEVNHRVKNNLQLISSILRLNMRELTDEREITVMSGCIDRIHVMAFIHETLYTSDKLASIAPEAFIRFITDAVVNAYMPESPPSIRLEVNCGYMNLDTAIPCGLIVNELITNIMKYAFVDRDPKQNVISITLKAGKRNNSFVLNIRDNGIGIPDSFWKQNTSFGMKLITALTRQMRGDISYHSNSLGTNIKIIFFDDHKKKLAAE